MRIRWKRGAISDLRGYREWLSTIEGAKPDRTILRVRAAVERLKRTPRIGRLTAGGLRQLSVLDAPYVVVYRIGDDVIDVLAVYHMAQDR